MKSKALLASVFIIFLVGAIWTKRPVDVLENSFSKQIETVDVIDTFSFQSVENQMVSKAVVGNIPLKIQLASVEKSLEEKEVNELELDTSESQSDDEEEAFGEYEIFTGNSDYTGDDTEDNDAGNLGFEDDFPEAQYSYDDHSAEGYTQYSESYVDRD